jgi:hypothetical protein
MGAVRTLKVNQSSTKRIKVDYLGQYPRTK